MTVAALAATITYLENGVTTLFSVPFRFLPGTLTAVRRLPTGGEVALASGPDFSEAGGGTDAGGTLTLTGVSVAGAELTISRVTPRAQVARYVANDSFPAESHEQALDRQMLIAQEVDARTLDLAQRAYLAPVGGAGGELSFPPTLEHDWLAIATEGQTAFTFDGSADYELRLARNGAALNSPATSAPDYSRSGDIVTLFDPARAGDELYAIEVGGRAIATERRTGKAGYGYGALRTATERALDRFDIRDTAGIDLSGSHDAASDVARALAEAARTGETLWFPPCEITLGSEVAVPSGASMRGVGTVPYRATIDGTSRGEGTWFHIAHSGIGFNCSDAGALASGTELIGIGTHRTQPAIAPGFVPTAHDFDILVNNTDIYLDDVTLLNPTKGLKLSNGLAGRLTIGRLRGQPLLTGIEIEHSLDLFTADFIQFWPFWANDDDVHDYTAANLDAVRLYRADGPHIDTLFSIFAKTTLRLSENAFGKTTGGKISHLYCDAHGAAGMLVDSNVGSAIIQIGMMNSQAKDGLAGTRAILIDGDNCQIDIAQHRSTQTGAEVFKSTGTGNNVRIAMPAVTNYNQDNGGFAAYEPGSSDSLTLGMAPQVSGSNNGGAVYGGSNTISAPDHWYEGVATITSDGGDFGSITGNVTLWQIVGDLCETKGYFTTATVGGASGQILLELPFEANERTPGSVIVTAGGTDTMLPARVDAGDSTLKITAGSLADGNVYAYSIRYRL